jgi:hypothetical protein
VSADVTGYIIDALLLKQRHDAPHEPSADAVN